MTTKILMTCLVGLSAAFPRAALAVDCSKAEDVLGLSLAATAAIPEVGGAAAASLTLFTTLLCDDLESLDNEDVLGLIRTELDQTAEDRALDTAQEAQQEIAVIAEVLGQFDGDLANLDDPTAIRVENSINGVIDRITDGIDDFKAALTRENNARSDYNISMAILLTNYNLALLQLHARIPGTNLTGVRADLGNIIEDVEAFRTESNRLRDIRRVVDLNFGEYTGALVRDGFSFGQRVRMTSVDFSSEQVTREDRFERVREVLSRRMRGFYEKLDVQDTRLALIEARARALLDDLFAPAAPSVAQTIPVLLVNASDRAEGNRCLANRKGRLRRGQLQAGATRMRNCDPLLSHHQWFLRDDGRIQASIADICLTAKSDGKVLIEACAATGAARLRQTWTRVGDRFRVEVDDVQTCLTPGLGGLNNDSVVARHIPCDEAVDHQRWWAFSPLQGGRPVQLPAIQESDVSAEGIEAFAAEMEEAVTSSGPCLFELSPSSKVQQGADIDVSPGCSRYSERFLWAHGADGLLRVLSHTAAALGTLPGATPSAVVLTGHRSPGAEAVAFDRTREPDGSSLFVRRVDGNILLRVGRLLFLDDSVVEDSDDSAFWQHFSGGRLAGNR